MTRNLLIVSALLAFTATLSVAFLGFMLMSGSGHAMDTCFGVTPGGTCLALGPVEHFQAHFNAFQSVATGMARAFIAFTVLLVGFFASFLAAPPARGYELLFARTEEARAAFFKTFVRWLSLHEKRDPSFASAVNA